MHALQDREAQATRLVKLESEQAQLEREYERFQTKERLLQAVWNWSETPGAECVRTHVKNLRAKLAAAGAPPDLVETVYGVGFRLHPNHAT